MIKNIIFDIGGIILDDSVENLSKIYDKDMSDIYKKVYSGDFKRCLLGKLSMNDYIKEFKDDKERIVNAAIESGLKAKDFKSINDVEVELFKQARKI